MLIREKRKGLKTMIVPPSYETIEVKFIPSQKEGDNKEQRR